MPALNSNLRINGDRLWDSLMEMAKIGPGIAGGNKWAICLLLGLDQILRLYPFMLARILIHNQRVENMMAYLECWVG